MTENILIIGACGQLGSELTQTLRGIYGSDHVVATDINEPLESIKDGPFEKLNVLDKAGLEEILRKYKITQIYNLAALLSATGEKNPMFAWELNMNGLLFSLEAARDLKISKVYWPSSIAVFGPNTPMNDTPQHTIMDPNTVYGISKLAGERWCEYFYHKFGVDVRSIRYPGLISYKTLPGGGTTDYAVDIYHKAVAGDDFKCFLSPDTILPMMYMDDAVRGTIQLMDAPAEQVKIRSSYNLAAISFNPEEIYQSILPHYPEFKISYEPDFRQKIADSWPNTIDDSAARADWGWKAEFDLAKMTQEMLSQLALSKA